MAQQTVASPARSNDSANIGEVVIEVGNDRNQNPIFPPRQQPMRGSWRREFLRGGEHDDAGLIDSIGDIPGLHIMCDYRTKLCKIYDPLGFPEYARTLQRIKDVLLKINRERIEPEADYIYPTTKDGKEVDNGTMVKTWLYWMRRLVDGDLARVVKGILPTEAQIDALPGMTRISLFASNRRKLYYKETQEADMKALEQAMVASD